MKRKHRFRCLFYLLRTKNTNGLASETIAILFSNRFCHKHAMRWFACLQQNRIFSQWVQYFWNETKKRENKKARETVCLVNYLRSIMLMFDLLWTCFMQKKREKKNIRKMRTLDARLHIIRFRRYFNQIANA